MLELAPEDKDVYVLLLTHPLTRRSISHSSIVSDHNRHCRVKSARIMKLLIFLVHICMTIFLGVSSEASDVPGIVLFQLIMSCYLDYLHQLVCR